MTIPTTGRVLALDWGLARIGVAITDETQLLASPLGTLTRRAGKRLPLGPFLDLVERELPVGLVVGLPLDDEGAEGESAQAASDAAAGTVAGTASSALAVAEAYSAASATDTSNQRLRRTGPGMFSGAGADRRERRRAVRRATRWPANRTARASRRAATAIPPSRPWGRSASPSA